VAFSALQLLDLALGAGFQGDHAIVATAIALAESGGDPNVLNPQFWTRGQLMSSGKVCERDYCGDYSLGLWQINMRPDLSSARLALFGLPRREALYDPATNARVAHRLYSGRGGSFVDWSTWDNGRGVFLRHMPAARTAWALRAAEQPVPEVTPPNPPGGPAPMADSGPILYPEAFTAPVPAPPGSVDPYPGIGYLQRWGLRLSRWLYRRMSKYGAV
jgi:hypothetical protein